MEDLNTKNSSNKEIERKFLVDISTKGLFSKLISLLSSERHTMDPLTGSAYIRQGYLSLDPKRTIRVRIIDNAHAAITIKGETVGISKDEFEYSIPVKDAEIMIQQICMHPIIEKVRHTVWINQKLWEIDFFEGENEGLIIAEVELDSEDEDIDIPNWIGEEVSNDPRYFNSSLVKNPFKSETFSV